MSSICYLMVYEVIHQPNSILVQLRIKHLEKNQEGFEFLIPRLLTLDLSS